MLCAKYFGILVGGRGVPRSGDLVIARDPVIGGSPKLYAKGAQSLKSTPIWDDLGCGGIPGEGEARRLPKSPKLPKSIIENQTSPQINADIRRSGMESTGLMGDRR